MFLPMGCFLGENVPGVPWRMGSQRKMRRKASGHWSDTSVREMASPPRRQHCGPPRIREEPSCEKLQGQQVAVSGPDCAQLHAYK